MKIMVVGSGGREHTLVWKLSQSPLAEKIYAVPGNPGMAKFAECVDISIDDNGAIVSFAKKNEIGLVVVGPEVPLTNGVIDALTAAGIKAFGPSKLAAEIEGSKAFSKNLMKKYRIPTANYEIFNDASRARVYVRQMGAPIVVKADGLAAGKGVVVAQTIDEAIEAINNIMDGMSFGAAGNRVVIEEFMSGEEASMLCFTDGDTIKPMISSQDHKCIYDGDKGPNTGGMGTYAPAPVITEEIKQEVQEKILQPVIEAMKKEDRKYIGCLYAGLMITEKGPKVVEFNARFGDPETQVVLPLLKSDLVEVMLACVDGKLDDMEIEWDDGAAVCVVIAAGGYPKIYEKGKEIKGIEAAEANGNLVIHAGTKADGDKILSNGGRVLGIVGKAADISSAVDKAYEGVGKISFDDMYYRHDIAHRALERL